MANILVINPEHPQPRKIAQAVKVLDAGGVIVYPTDTVYGLGCDLHNRKAIDKIYQLKGLDRSHLLSFVCPDLAGVAQYGRVSDFAYRLLRRILPGPYTVVLEAKPLVPRVLLQKRRTVGIRIPDSPIALALVEALGRPIISTSVTDPDGDIMIDPAEMRDYYGKKGVDLVIDGGILGNIPSTVFSIIDDEVEILREGKGPLDLLGA